MNTQSQDILAKLPDFEDLLGLSDSLSALVAKKLVLDNKIKTREAEIIKEVMINPVYFVGGKPPAISFVSTAYLHTGLSGELVPLRDELAGYIAEIERLKSRFDIFKELFNMWRSLNASERIVNAS